MRPPRGEAEGVPRLAARGVRHGDQGARPQRRLQRPVVCAEADQVGGVRRRLHRQERGGGAGVLREDPERRERLLRDQPDRAGAGVPERQRVRRGLGVRGGRAQSRRDLGVRQAAVQRRPLRLLRHEAVPVRGRRPRGGPGELHARRARCARRAPGPLARRDHLARGRGPAVPRGGGLPAARRGRDLRGHGGAHDRLLAGLGAAGRPRQALPVPQAPEASGQV
mmetsp:Transcript_109766/g.310550  ORF Transcript_109766/g.310550 Transcript_109766/m.310550 type:complete len:223 (-) Transcript_109766:507-1175(-)